MSLFDLVEITFMNHVYQTSVFKTSQGRNGDKDSSTIECLLHKHGDLSLDPQCPY